MIGRRLEDDEVSTRFPAADAEDKLNGDVALRINVLADQRLGDLLANVLLGRFLALSDYIDEIEDLSLLDDNRR